MDLRYRVADRYKLAQGLEDPSDVADYWAEVFLDELDRNTEITENGIDALLRSQGLTAEDINGLSDESDKQAGGFVSALSGLVLKGLWHMLTQPFFAVGKLIKSPEFRSQVKASFKKALNHEARASRHMLLVAGRIAKGEEVNTHEKKAAMRQLGDILTKAVLIYLAGPSVSSLFKGGLWKALGSLLAPMDEILAILLNKPIRAATKRLMSETP